jgi:capsular polysaccharide biosynthesis protein
MLAMHNGDHPPEHLWAYDDYTEFDDQPVDSGAGPASLGFFRAALRRRKWVWRGTALAGLLIGAGLAVKLPVVYQASTSVLVTPISTSGESPLQPVTNEQAIAQSRTVAELAMSKLGLQESLSKFLSSYTVTPTTDRVITITVNAPSSSDAVSRANALATGYLRFRAELAEDEQNLLIKSLDQQVSQAKQNIDSIDAQISQVSAQAYSSSQQAELARLAKQKTQATNALTQLEQTSAADEATAQVTTDTVVQGSRQLDPAAALPSHSRLKRTLEYGALGLIAGLFLGLGVVVIGALLSDRLRRRDDVAHALGAPVKLSIGTVRGSRRIGLEAASQDTNLRRVIAYLDKAVPSARGRPASLAVVPVDDVHLPAVCLAALAVSRAKQGMKVVLADLCDGAPAARLLGDADSGVRTVSAEGTQLTVAIPEPDDVLPAGPFPGRPGQAHAAEPLAAVCASADLVLVLAVLDPSLGGEHLAGWVGGAVVTITAGQSSATRIRAAAEMIRLSGTSLISGVLIGADKTDESLGLPLTQDGGRAAIAEESLRSDGDGFVTVDEGSGRRPTGRLCSVPVSGDDKARRCISQPAGMLSCP